MGYKNALSPQQHVFTIFNKVITFMFTVTWIESKGYEIEYSLRDRKYVGTSWIFGKINSYYISK